MFVESTWEVVENTSYVIQRYREATMSLLTYREGVPVGVQSLVLSLRPAQWTKNLIIFAGLLFGQRLLDPGAVLYSLAAFAVFCALSGVVYLIMKLPQEKDENDDGARV